MALQGSGAIALSELATEFSDSTPNSMSEYYRAGGKVSTNNTGVPTSGVIALTDFYSAFFAIVLDITANTSDYDILTAATSAGYNAGSDTTPIIVNVASGVTVSGSASHAMKTGALNADSDLTINIDGSIDGYTGATGATDAAGSPGGDALYWETLTGGSGTYTVNVSAGANLRGGGGGGGGGGAAGAGQPTYNAKTQTCSGETQYGSTGSAGSSGGFGAAGSAGSPGGNGGGDPDAECVNSISAPGSGGAGGAAGFALRKNGRTVTLNNSGTVAGSAA